MVPIKKTCINFKFEEINFIRTDKDSSLKIYVLPPEIPYFDENLRAYNSKPPSGVLFVCQ